MRPTASGITGSGDRIRMTKTITKGTRRHANLRQLRGKTMIMLTATPINNSATDLENLISLFTSPEELRNKASLDFDAFEEYIDLSETRKQIAAGKEEATEEEQRKDHRTAPATFGRDLEDSE